MRCWCEVGTEIEMIAVGHFRTVGIVVVEVVVAAAAVGAAVAARAVVGFGLAAVMVVAASLYLKNPSRFYFEPA